jgi:hypothetical protein
MQGNIAWLNLVKKKGNRSGSGTQSRPAAYFAPSRDTEETSCLKRHGLAAQRQMHRFAEANANHEGFASGVATNWERHVNVLSFASSDSEGPASGGMLCTSKNYRTWNGKRIIEPVVVIA